MFGSARLTAAIGVFVFPDQSGKIGPDLFGNFPVVNIHSEGDKPIGIPVVRRAVLGPLDLSRVNPSSFFNSDLSILDDF